MADQWKDPIEWASQIEARIKRVSEAFDEATSETAHLAWHFTDVVNLLNGFLWLVEKKILILSPAHAASRETWIPVWEFTQGAYEYAGRDDALSDDSTDWGRNLEAFKAVADQLGYVFVKVDESGDHDAMHL